MKTGLQQHTGLRQELRINPRLYQAMDMLYMPMLDLQQHLQHELLGNPFLELEEPEEEAQPEKTTEEEQAEVSIRHVGMRIDDDLAALDQQEPADTGQCERSDRAGYLQALDRRARVCQTLRNPAQLYDDDRTPIPGCRRTQLVERQVRFQAEIETGINAPAPGLSGRERSEAILYRRVDTRITHGSRFRRPS